MKPFSLDSSMLSTLGNTFYPTGHSMVLFAEEAQARAVADRLAQAGVPSDDIQFLPAATILSQIAPTAGGADDPLPSAGTEGATVRAYTKLAQDGHVALLVKTDEDEDADRLVAAMADTPRAMAQRYRTLVIEDL
ncbi:MAG: hypothetical protein ABIW85_08710 [Variovorax sp.]